MKLLSGGNPMTEQEIAGLGPAFANYLGRYRACFLQKRTAAHFDTYCRGLLSDLPRKSVEPIALEAGTAVRTLQEFLVTARWVSMGASKPATYGRFKTSQGDGSQFRPQHSVTPGEPLAQHCSLTRTEKQASEGPGGGNEPPGRCTDAATSSAGRRQRQL